MYTCLDTINSGISLATKTEKAVLSLTIPTYIMCKCIMQVY